MNQFNVILLAGGKGTRMNAGLPKQYLSLYGKTVLQHSLDLFLSMKEVQEIVVVAAVEYRSLLSYNRPITFAHPGLRRQDSVLNGLNVMQSYADFVAIHDGARPCITSSLVKRTFAAAKEYGAAAPGVAVTCTIKECDLNQIVTRTPKRSLLWEIQTPQIIKRSLLNEGFEYVRKYNLEVTDDLSLVEHLSLPVKIVQGSSSNLKITFPEDLPAAEHFLKNLTHEE